MSDLNFIVCPQCSHQVPINEALSHQVEEKFRKDFELKQKEIDEEKKKLDDIIKQLRGGG